AFRALEQRERQRVVKREPPRPEPARFRTGALAHSLCNPCVAALAARREPPALGASPLNPLAPSLDHRGHDARLAVWRLRPGRSPAMHSTAAVRHRPCVAKGIAENGDAVRAAFEEVLDPRAAALALPRSISATMIARAQRHRLTLKVRPSGAENCF